MKYLIYILFIFFFLNSLMASDFKDRHPVYSQIVSIKPNINKAYAMKLSNIIYRYSIIFSIDKMLMTAIIAQESMFKLNVIGYGGNDYGLTQINIGNIKSLNLDMDKLMNDLDYSVWAGFRILSEFKRFRESESKTWWSRYNTGNAASKQKYREEYERKVCRFYKGERYCMFYVSDSLQINLEL